MQRPLVRPIPAFAALCAAWIGVSACTGAIAPDRSRDPDDDPVGGEGGDPVQPAGGTGGAVVGGPPVAESAGPRPLRRLTRDEYNHTVRDLLGDDSHPADAFPADVRGDGGFFDPLAVSGVETTRYRDAAEALGEKARADVARLAPCAAGATAAAQEACAIRFIDSFGKRAFRRPPANTDRDRLIALYRAVRGKPLEDDHATALGVLVSAMLQAPQFLYHWETPAERAVVEGGLVALDPYELASRLSYFLWSSMPDEALFAAADAGTLTDRAELERHTRRMLGDARAADTVRSFFEQLLDAERLPGLVKDTNAYPAWGDGLASAMLAETAAFTRWAVLEDGHLATLLTSPQSFVDARLAKLYGAANVSGNGPQRVTLNAAQRFGLLTQGTFLSVHANTYETSPIARGKLILERLLCQTVPPPPPDVETDIPPPKPNQQTREKFEAHEESPACAACHKLMDPLGFAFEGYDGIGAWRTTDAGRPVRTDGKAVLASRTIQFNGARELVDALASSDEGRQCMATQWLRFGLGRGDVAADTGSLQRALATLTKTDDLRELIVALVGAKTFTHRAPSEGEVLR